MNIIRKPCKRGHITTQNKYGACKECCKIFSAEWRKRHPDKARAMASRWYSKNREHSLSRYKLWVVRNRARRTATQMARETKKLKATPIWLTKLDKELIIKKYELAGQLTQSTGILHHVDHIIPLQGRIVSGLHVLENLQVIPAIENQRKSNRLQE